MHQVPAILDLLFGLMVLAREVKLGRLNSVEIIMPRAINSLLFLLNFLFLFPTCIDFYLAFVSRVFGLNRMRAKKV